MKLILTRNGHFSEDVARHWCVRRFAGLLKLRRKFALRLCLDFIFGSGGGFFASVVLHRRYLRISYVRLRET